MMKNSFYVLLLSLIVFSCSKKEETIKDELGFDQDPKTGLFYKIHKSENTNTDKIKLNDTVYATVCYKTEKDSIVWEIKNDPVKIPIVESSFKGDFMDGFKLLRLGDSASFRIPVDSLYLNDNRPSYLVPGSKIMYSVKIERVDNPKNR